MAVIDATPGSVDQWSMVSWRERTGAGHSDPMTLAELPPPSQDIDDPTGRLEALLALAIERVRVLVEADVERVRRRKPALTQDELARAVVKRGTRRVGAASFATGFGGAPTIALNITSVLTLQASLVLAVAAAYDELDSPDLRQDLILILAGNSAVTEMRTFGVAAANDMGKKWV